MNSPNTRPLDEHRVRRVELIISTLLRAGVFLSFTVIVAGTVVSFIRHADYVSSQAALNHLTRPGAAFPHSVRQVIDGVRHMRGQAIVVLGLLLLIATPVVRVAVSVLAFIYEGDLTFVVITLVVLCLLITSFLLGRAAG